MNIQAQYEAEIKPEVEALASEIGQAISHNTSIEAYHKGWRVFFSPVFHNPKVLLIGINPGGGQAGVEDYEFWDESYLFEYVNPEENNYALARETNAVFAEAGLTEILQHSTVKTNFFFLSTTELADLYQITTFLGRGSNTNQEFLGDKFFRKSYQWTKHLIDIIQPEVIVCEGKEAYKNVTDLYPEFGEYDWQGECGYTVVPSQKLVIIGYNRRGSRILDKVGLAKLLERFVMI